MSKVIAIANGKGGVGKSTITSNLCGYLYNLNEKEVLIVDLDLQTSSLDWASIARSYGKDVCDVVSLAGEKIERHLIVKNIQMQVSRLKKKYDYILIDCRGTLDEYTIGAIRSADIVITPLSSSPVDIQATTMLLDLFEQVNATKDYSMTLWMVLNGIVPNTNTLKDAKASILETISGNNHIKLCDAIIYRREDYKTAWGHGGSIFDTDNEKGKEDFLSFIKEVAL